MSKAIRLILLLSISQNFVRNTAVATTTETSWWSENDQELQSSGDYDQEEYENYENYEDYEDSSNSSTDSRTLTTLINDFDEEIVDENKAHQTSTVDYASSEDQNGNFDEYTTTVTEDYDAATITNNFNVTTSANNIQNSRNVLEPRHRRISGFNGNTTFVSEDYNMAQNASSSSRKIELADDTKQNDFTFSDTRNHIAEVLPSCPPGFSYKSTSSYSKFCYVVTKPTKFPPTCPYFRNIPYDTNIFGVNGSDIREFTNQSVWAYPKVNTDDRSKHFKLLEYFDIPYSKGQSSYGSNSTESNCLIVSNSKLEPTQCENEFPVLCIYSLFENDCARRFNSSCFGRYITSPNTCFCKIESPNLQPRKTFCNKLAEFVKPHQDYLMKRYGLSDDGECWIKLDRNTQLLYQSSSANLTINYTYWAPNVDYTKPFSALTNLGLTLRDDQTLNCAICQVEITKQPHVRLYLKYNEITSKLELRIVNPSEIHKSQVTCFKKNSHQIRINLPLSLNRKYQMVNVSEVENGILTNYWCKALQMSDLTQIYSNEIVINKLNSGMHQYVIQIRYPVRDYSYLLDNGETACQSMWLQNPELIQSVWSMKIVSYNSSTGTIEVLCHFTTAFENIEEELQRFSQMGYEKILSSEGCQESATVSGDKILHWPKTNSGITTTPDEICLQENGSPVTRTCLGNFLFGSAWSEVNGTCANVTPSPRTLALDGLLRTRNIKPDNLSRSLLDITKSNDNVTSFQVHLISEVLNKLVKIASSTEIENIIKILNNVMHFERKSLKSAQQLLNSTDNFLNELDESLIRTKTNDQDYEISVVTERLLVQEINLQNSNVYGIKLEGSGGGFTKNDLKFLHETVSENALIAENLETAIIISEEFKNDIKNCPSVTSNPSIITSLFYDDTLFNEYDNFTGRSEGKIVSVIIPDFNCDFNVPLKVLFKSTANNTQLKCASWIFSSTDLLLTPHGGWVVESDPKAISGSNFQLCEFTHVTHFALLVLGDTEDAISETHKRNLDIITAVGSGLSILGLFIVFLTAIIFKSFRSANGVVINFSVAMTAQIILLFVADTLTDDPVWCTVFGALLHYIVLAQFFWMLTIAFLQYKRYVLIFSNPTTYLVAKCCAFCWGLPLIPIIVIVSISTENYAKNSYGLCYAIGNYFIFGVLVPVCIIVLFNLLIFLRILINIASSRNIRTHQKKDDTSMLQLRLAIMLYFLLGLTWGFGLLAAVRAGIVYSYLFCLTATLQGFILFLYFIILNEKTRQLWIDLTSCKKSGSYNPNNDSVDSAMMQRRGRNTNVSETSYSDTANSWMLQKYKNRNSSDFT